MTMADILAVNPSILSATGMDSGVSFTPHSGDLPFSIIFCLCYSFG